MKARSFILMLAALGIATTAWSAQPVNYTPMKVIQTFTPVYPRSLADIGIKQGETHVSIQVDEQGQLTDHLVTYYTHAAFAESATQALKKWKYEPAWLDGEARSATVDLTFIYENQGLTVVNLDPGVYVMRRSMELMPGTFGYRVARLRELDRIPTPKKVVSPPYPVDASGSPRAAKVTVTFFIDEEGRVRLPAVSRDATEGNELFASAAITAVSQWEFEPPTANGRRALVQVRQDFNFNPTTATKQAE
ncbi:MAG TPA: TonB family protein [Opitutus sp.]|nr:TonB family protein [Opitutus sp.]